VGPQAQRAGAGLARGDKFVAAVEEVSREIQDPAAKLFFLRESLARPQSRDRAVSSVPWLDRVLHPWMDRNGDGTETAISTLGVPVRVIARRRLGSRMAAVAAVLALAALLGAGILRATRPSVTTPALAAVPTLPVAESLPLLPAAVAPSAIWLVEKGADWELFSNGLRIDTTFAVTGDPRRFKVFEQGLGLKEEVYTKPVGIVFHTSESDIWPLEASFNESLRDSSQHLLRYLVRNRCYNYLIDRFGRVYRVVEEETKANHAGTSIWANGKNIYLNLNNSFLGVSFETRWEGGRALPITQAQLAAGRSLTEYLRLRGPRPREHQPDEAPDRQPHGLVQGVPFRRLRPA
jgi:N-acetylmuramoyl-L-alanine amidase